MKTEKCHIYLSTKERNEIVAVYQGTPQMFFIRPCSQMRTEQTP